MPLVTLVARTYTGATLNKAIFMNCIKSLMALIPLAFLCGCSNPAKDVPTASVDQPKGATNAAAPTEPEGRYFAFGPTNSAIDFTGSKVTRSHQGGFRNRGA